MKILFDHLCFNQKYGGVSKYFVELIKRLPEEDVIQTIRYSNNEFLKELSIKKLYSFFPSIEFKGKARLESCIGKIYSAPSLLKNDFNIYHQTHYDPYAYRYLDKNVKTITTIHDMNFWTIPDFYPKNSRLMRNQLISAQKANHIITVSHNSKKDICKYWNIPADKISVIYHGINTEQYNSTPAYISPHPYILFVGSRNKYKNFEGLVKSFSILKKKYPDLKLYCAGMSASNQDMSLLKQFGISNSIMFFQASDQQLISLYKGAKVFVFPSFHEGFGLPILEAMAANCPVVLSNTSCFPEIAQEAGSYFNPYDVDEMTAVIDNVLCDVDYSLSLKEKGAKLVKDFSWDKCAQQHIKLYQSLL